MAGEIEEPCSFNFLANSLHSGSISFGRFECEPLSWERRSSFSHNRYLEEVEKCSKPGSVTEKKAHFEAFFKRKALLSQTPNEGQNGTEHQNSTTDVSEISISFQEDCVHSPNVSETNEECKPILDEREESEDTVNLLKRESNIAPAFNSTDTIEADFKHGKTWETVFGNLHVDSAELVAEIKEILIIETVTISDVSKSTDSFDPGSSEEGPSLSQQSLPVRENKLTKTMSKSMANDTQPRKNIRAKPSEYSSENHSISGKQTTRVIKSVKQQPSPILNQTLRRVRRTSPPPESRSVPAKLNYESKSVRDIKTKKVVEARANTLEKDESERCRTQNRTKRIVKPSPVNFSFKSDERAERRKKFFVKLGKKTRAKEVEMNQVQAKTQEKTEAEIKQFRKSLNFKATPMPSFYQETQQPLLYKSKVQFRPTS